MQNFEYLNPVKILFGKNTIGKVSKELKPYKNILLLYGKNSIKKNGVYEQTMLALKKYSVFEFSGIEANPEYDTLIKALDTIRENNIDFLLSVGGGSILDGTKFIAAAALFEKDDPWLMLQNPVRYPVKKALPVGSIMTLAATGSEMNGYSVISRKSKGEKLAFGSQLLYPKFSILDPETTYSLSEHQTVNGIVDAFIHVMEQYMTFDSNAPLQDRQAEAVLKTLIEEAAKVISNPGDYNTRANIMWCATQALNGHLACGVPEDWTTHYIGHELTALFGLDHARSLAIVEPELFRQQLKTKKDKLAQYGKRIWNIEIGDNEKSAFLAIEKTEKFFQSLGVKTKLSDYNIKVDEVKPIIDKFEKKKIILGENKNITHLEVKQILKNCF